MIIGNPAVADVEVDETTLTLTGAALGKTTLSVTLGGKTRTWPVLVRTAVLAQRLELTMAVGEQREVTVSGLMRITMGDASVVDVTTPGQGQLHFSAGTPGKANVFVWTRDAKRFEYVVEVVAGATPVPSVDLVVGLQQVLVFSAVDRVEIGEASICEVKRLGDQEVLLLPQSPGKTLLRVRSGEALLLRSLVVRAGP